MVYNEDKKPSFPDDSSFTKSEVSDYQGGLVKMKFSVERNEKI